MEFGPLTTLEQLSQKLLIRWVPKWHEVFYDPQQHNFHERLARGFKPAALDARRLLTQCRQLAIYSHASLQEDRLDFNPDLRNHFQSIKSQFYVPTTGGWRFSIADDGSPKDSTYDLYATGFVVFALTHYYRATQDEEARKLAISTLEFIDRNFRLQDLPGLAEGLDENLQPLTQIRRQNPHMHLLEACLFAAATWPDSLFRKMADEMVGLFFKYFYDQEKNTLCEWFNDDLTPHPEKGHVVEPGHYFEWIWLLKKHDAGRYDDTCRKLLDWANAYGWDEDFGGIYDEIGTDGKVIGDTKRIWPFTEALKANALMLAKDQPENNIARKERIAGMVSIFKNKYIEERGFWTERLNRDLTPATDYMPGTTPYHVYFGIMETREILRARGKSKSIAPSIYGLAYRLRRRVSNILRGIKNAFSSAASGRGSSRAA